MQADESKKQIQNFWSKIKEIKNIKLILLVLVIAIALIVYSIIAENYKKKTSTTSVQTETSESNNKNFSSEISYSDDEKRIADILSHIDGIGNTKVLITKDESQKNVGVIVVAQGAEKPLVEWQIRHAIQTALQIDYNSIEVYSMN